MSCDKCKGCECRKIKRCIDCKEIKNVSDFYKAREKWMLRCKKCHNKTRKNYKPSKSTYVKRKVGFQKLNKEIREEILKDLENKKTYKYISEKYDIKYVTFLSWVKKGWVN